MIKSYILILSLGALDTSGGVAMHSVEFADRQSCEHAKTAWLNQMSRKKLRVKNAICVKR